MMDDVTLLHEDCLELLKTVPADSVDAVCTDPPYHLTSIVKRFGGANAAPAQFGTDGAYQRVTKGFMGKEWDGGDIAFRVELWTEVLRVLKPGGHLLSCGGTRTYHRMACAIEDAGFEIRDSIGYAWVYASGFPKSHDVAISIDKMKGAIGARGKAFNTAGNGERKDLHANGQTSVGVHTPISDEAREWEGWGTALKPAWEPIVLARKCLSEQNIALNVLKHGTGGINIDAGRIGTSADTPQTMGAKHGSVAYGKIAVEGGKEYAEGRWPANAIFDEHSATELDRQSGVTKSGFMSAGTQKQGKPVGIYGEWKPQPTLNDTHGDEGGASRFFYVAKPSTSERNCAEANGHPTVKPLALMRYLVRLICQPGGVVLDPFMGSGTTGAACVMEGFRFIGMEREAEYLEISRRRIAAQTGNLFGGSGE